MRRIARVLGILVLALPLLAAECGPESGEDAVISSVPPVDVPSAAVTSPTSASASAEIAMQEAEQPSADAAPTPTPAPPPSATPIPFREVVATATAKVPVSDDGWVCPAELTLTFILLPEGLDESAIPGADLFHTASLYGVCTDSPHTAIDATGDFTAGRTFALEEGRYRWTGTFDGTFVAGGTATITGGPGKGATYTFTIPPR